MSTLMSVPQPSTRVVTRLVAAPFVLAVALGVRLLPFHITRGIVARLCRSNQARPASLTTATSALTIIDAASTLCPLRVACVERSVAAVVAHAMI